MSESNHTTDNVRNLRNIPADLTLLRHRYREWSRRVDQAQAQYDACPCATCLAAVSLCEEIAGSIWSEMKGGGA
jgi:hypothetical protein